MFRVNAGGALGTLTINGGNFVYEAAAGSDTTASGNRYVVHSNGIVTINGGTFSSNNGYAAVYQFGADNTMTINGGKFNPAV
ncbi:MAG: hypothetical protein II358_02145, partial [Tidjanibacter sp.]|nr:hypothetical protein [Tidjanibacter sp.]